MRLGLVLGEAAQGLRRNVAMVISVVLVTFISLTFVGAAILIQMQIGQMKGYWYDRAQVAVYFCTDGDTAGNCTSAAATSAQIAAVKAELESSTLKPFVKSFQFETHKEAYDNFKQQFPNSPLLSYTTPSALNEAYRVNLVDPNKDGTIVIEDMSERAGVESVIDQRQYLDQIFAVLNAASVTAISVASLMLIAAVLLIATTIRLSAFSRRREIGIMRLVGASNRYIQTPFVLEGVFAALIGAVLAGGAIVGIVQFFVEGYLANLKALAGTTLIGVSDSWVVFGILIALGAVLASLSSSAAISRYLRV